DPEEIARRRRLPGGLLALGKAQNRSDDLDDFSADFRCAIPKNIAESRLVLLRWRDGVGFAWDQQQMGTNPKGLCNPLQRQQGGVFLGSPFQLAEEAPIHPGAMR